MVSDGDEGVGDGGDAVDGILVGVLSVGAVDGVLQAGETGVAESVDEIDHGGVGGVEGGGFLGGETAYGVDEGGGVLSEVMEDDELGGEDVDGHTVLRLHGLKEFKDLFAGVSLVLGRGVEGVEKDDGDSAGILALEIVAIGEHVGRKVDGRGGSGDRGGEDGDFLRCALVGEGEVVFG